MLVLSKRDRDGALTLRSVHFYTVAHLKKLETVIRILDVSMLLKNKVFTLEWRIKLLHESSWGILPCFRFCRNYQTNWVLTMVIPVSHIVLVAWIGLVEGIFMNVIGSTRNHRKCWILNTVPLCLETHLRQQPLSHSIFNSLLLLNKASLLIILWSVLFALSLLRDYFATYSAPHSYPELFVKRSKYAILLSPKEIVWLRTHALELENVSVRQWHHNNAWKVLDKCYSLCLKIKVYEVESTTQGIWQLVLFNIAF